ncbi:hypothetical protein [Dermabacter vaginalis]|uniref:hypothetical protein n=1 Tax=Dermabacter vaginalis TaxID=1630135 RepID=UPI0012FC14C7|nr:hypothetical protein [Dermabacter vaginalis]MCG7443543.1 hypothetical protein [Dermabacter vaginalis]
MAASVSALGLVMALGACSGEKKPETPTVQPAPTGQGQGQTQPSDGEGNKDTTSAPSEDTASSGSDGINTGCSLPDGDQKIPNSAPPVDEWVDVNGTGVPTSKTYGPEKREGDLFGCYAHSPTGALFAMVYFGAASGKPEGFLDAWVTPEDLATIPENRRGSSGDSGVTLTLRGFRFSSATQDKVTADLAWHVTTDEGQNATMVSRIIMKWSGDHWTMDPEMGDTPVTRAPANLDGFTLWSAGNS